MPHQALFQVTGIIILGILAQWVAWRLKLPSILLLLSAGTVAGPLTGLLQPDTLFGDLLSPIVSLSVAVILYEGGLSLRFRELRDIEGVFFRMTTLGVFISWLIGAMAAHYLLDFRWPIAALLGAVFVVTGPTVIGPLLRHIRLRSRLGALLKWEGIVVDPLGAVLAVLVFTMVQADEIQKGVAEAGLDLCLTLALGVVFGCAAAGILILALRRFWIPDSLHNPVSLMLMFASFTAANAIQDESGMLAVTVMGIALANQKWISIQHVVEFKETLGVLLISCLFILLAARLRPEDLHRIDLKSYLFVGVMIFVARPASVLLSAWGSPLSWRERFFLSCMAPRGIVAAAVSSVFAMKLTLDGYPRSVEMVPLTFLLVFITVLVYGLCARPLARRLGLVNVNPQGILFVGAHAWSRALAGALRKEGVPVMLVDTDWENISSARMAGLPCYYGSALAEKTREDIDFGDLGRLLAVTANNEVNALACLRYVEDFGRQEVYQLPFPFAQEGRHEVVPMEHRGRLLFGQELTYSRLNEIMGNQPAVKTTKLTGAFTFKDFQAEHGETVIPLFVLRMNGSVQVYTVNDKLFPQVEDSIISIVSVMKT